MDLNKRLQEIDEARKKIDTTRTAMERDFEQLKRDLLAFKRVKEEPLDERRFQDLLDALRKELHPPNHTRDMLDEIK